ncbi:hypothetical protein HDU79_004942 [Rhizoclosmatium sp. JEL0117]|nr:hypothetical protein HDU79_004942 [Rhizoclosmatium sp. JEL0117]
MPCLIITAATAISTIWLVNASITPTRSSFTQPSHTQTPVTVTSDSLLTTNREFSIPSVTLPSKISQSQLKQLDQDALVYPHKFVQPTHTSESTTIVFNLYSGPVENIESQLRYACGLHSAETPVTGIWVYAFASPNATDYRRVVQDANASDVCLSNNITVSFTESTFNYKFHGRFLLAPMVTSKYLMMVDDDVILSKRMLGEFIQMMRLKPRLLGTAGQLRSPRQGINPGWESPDSPQVQTSNPTEINQPRVDYLCNIWFMKSSWTLLLTRDHPLTWYTGEDIHCSYVLKKYLGVESAVVKLTVDVEDEVMPLLSKNHRATREVSVADVRNDLFRLNLGRGIGLELGGTVVKTVVFVQDVEAAYAVLKVFDEGRKGRKGSVDRDSVSGVLKSPSCMMFSGREESQEKLDLLRLVAIRYSHLASCELYLRPKWGSQPRPVRYFDLKLGFGIENGEYPVVTAAADMIPAVYGILNSGIDAKSLERVVMVTSQDRDKKKEEAKVYRQVMKLVVDMVNNEVGLRGGAFHRQKKRTKKIELVEVNVL